MPVYAVGEKVPAIHESAFIAPTATVVGDVRIEAGASIWYGAVVRGDSSYAVFGAGANIQDGAVVLVLAPACPHSIDAEAWDRRRTPSSTGRRSGRGRSSRTARRCSTGQW